MENFFNQFECKEAKAGEIVYDTKNFGNTLLFVPTGKLLISTKTAELTKEIDEGHFALLPAEKRYIATAAKDSSTVLMHAGPLSKTITDDPEWDPDHPVILPIFPALAKTISFLQSYQQQQYSKLN